MDKIRYFLNIKNGHFIQLIPTIEKPFSDDWVEIEQDAFLYLLNLYNIWLDKRSREQE